jgi:hypothetical protein
MDITANVVSAWNAFAIKVVGFLANLLGALLILLVGWVVAKGAKFAVKRFLGIVRFDQVSEKAGFRKILMNGGISETPAELMATLLYWFVMLIIVVASLNALNLPVVSDLVSRVLLYIPQVIAAVVVLVLGLLLGNFVAGVVRVAAGNAAIANADRVGQVAFYAIAIFAVSMALQQLGIAAELVLSAFSILFGAACLALAIAFGLGAKDVAGGLVKTWLDGKK